MCISLVMRSVSASSHAQDTLWLTIMCLSVITHNIHLSSLQIGDFGMSRDLADDTYYVSNGGKIPVKWTAPEAIRFKKYSTASDVWSYGCLLYEIWSIGHKPFEDIHNAYVSM